MRNAIIVFVTVFSLLSTTQAVAQEQIVLQAASDQGTLLVEITWTPDDIGRANSFDFRFIEPETGEQVEDIVYDFSIYYEGDREVLRSEQKAIRQEFTFDREGAYEIRIDDIDGLGEGVAVPIEVTPEFPLGVFLLVALAFGLVLLVARGNGKNLFRQQI